MKDLNFFSSYNTSNNDKNGVDRYLVWAAGAFAAIVVLTLVVNGVKIAILEMSMRKYEAALNEPNFQAQLKEAENINQKLDLLKKYEGKVSKVSDDAKKNNLITDELLTDISGALPKEASFTDLQIDGYELTIKGETSNRTSIAEFEHNLKGLSKLKSVHVNEIARKETVEESYTFQISIILKEVN